jgi:hypothetical protein
MSPRTELYIMREFKTQALNNIDDDTFERKTKCNDWGNHVPDSVIAAWKYLAGAGRALVALVALAADHAASAEDWD